jgi:DNA-binding NtrC family response regulator
MGNKIYQNVLLVIDDDKLLCDVIKERFSKDNVKVLSAHSMADGTVACSQNRVDIVLLDQNLPDGQGYSLCPPILKSNEQTKIIFITAYPSFENALKAIKGGAYDYLSKPFEMEALSLAVNNALKTLNLEKIANIANYRDIKEQDDAVLVGRSREFDELLKLIDLAASTDAPVLITGETGTGKNITAKAIHYKSPARKDAFICINCAALPENLIEAELFGYEKGAFTGAESSRRGIFEMAEGGTLLLDEIGEMPVHLQSKLLNVIEDKKIKRLGGDVIHSVNVRIIAATSADLEKAMGKTFRSDLYYRLSVLGIHILPLRERREDIPELCRYMLGKLSNERGFTLDSSELEKLMQYDWPGNIRELKNIIERSLLFQKNKVLKPSEFIGKSHTVALLNSSLAACNTSIPLSDIERKHIKSALQNFSGNYTQTARALKISLSTLKRKVKEYGLK